MFPTSYFAKVYFAPVYFERPFSVPVSGGFGIILYTKGIMGP